MFSYRQLWLNGYEIHLKNTTRHFYKCHEGQAAKNPNAVCTFTNDYVQEMPEDAYIFCWLPDQNRNNTVVKYLLAFEATKRFRKICH